MAGVVTAVVGVVSLVSSFMGAKESAPALPPPPQLPQLPPPQQVDEQESTQQAQQSIKEQQDKSREIRRRRESHTRRGVKLLSLDESAKQSHITKLSGE